MEAALGRPRRPVSYFIAALRHRLAARELLIPMGGLVAGAVVGVALAQSVPIGIGVLVAVLYLPIVMVSPVAGVILWVPLVFLQYVSGAGRAWQVAAVIIVLASLADPRIRLVARRFSREHSSLLLGLVLLLVWLFVSIGWGEKPHLALEYIPLWLIVAVLFFVVVSTITTRWHARILIIAFVVGAVISVLVGLVASSLVHSMEPIESAASATADAGRLQGGAGDPNVLAAGLVPAMALAAALGAGRRSVLTRLGILVVLVVLAVGLAATESRGGLVAAVVAMVAGLIVFKHHRAQVGALIVVVLLAGGAWLSVSPDAVSRIAQFDTNGTGRSDLWRVASRMWVDHPVAGVGLGNFTARSGEYVREPGTLTEVRLIVDRARVVHNVYLQLLAEEGLVGLLLFLGICAACGRAAMRAAHLFDAEGDRAMATLARAVIVAVIGLLAASAFLSNGFDKRLWLLLALGPTLFAIASSGRGPEAIPESAPG